MIKMWSTICLGNLFLLLLLQLCQSSLHVNWMERCRQFEPKRAKWDADNGANLCYCNSCTRGFCVVNGVRGSPPSDYEDCDSATCMAPLDVEHATFPACQTDVGIPTGFDIPQGKQCIPDCGTGYLPDKQALYCGSAGDFLDSFTCQEMSCTAPTVANSISTSSCKEGVTISHEGICTPQCQVGYIQSQSELACSLGVLFPSTYTCDAIVKADTPTAVKGVNAQTSSIEVEWNSGNLNDCTFSQYVVEWQKAGETEWNVAPYCSRLRFSEEKACEVNDLPPTSAISFRVATKCVDELANSLQSDVTAAVSTTGVNVESRPDRNEIVHIKPDMIMLMFSHGVKLKDTGRPFTLKMCNIGEAVQCMIPGADPCTEFSTDSVGFTLLPPEDSQFAFWQIDGAYPWRQGCEYQVKFDSADPVFETFAEPRNNVPVSEWTFEYQAEPPKFSGAQTVGTITQTSIDVELTWDKACKFWCRAEGENWGSTELAAPGETVTYTVGGVAASSGNDEVRTLRPLTSYTIECQAWLMEDEFARSPELYVATVTTEPERNPWLQDFTVYARPRCPNPERDPCAHEPPNPDPCQLPFAETWLQTEYEYTAALTTVDFDEDCNSGGTAAQWILQVFWMPQGDYSTTNTSDCDMIQAANSKQVYCFLPDLIVGRNDQDIFDSKNISIRVQAQDKAMPEKVYTFTAVALAITLKIQDVRIVDSDGNGQSFTDVRSAGTLQRPWHAEFDVTSNDDSRMNLIWDKVGLNIGKFVQTKDTSFNTIGSYKSTALRGIGVDLPIRVTVLGNPVVQWTEPVSFELPVLDCISTQNCEDCPADSPAASPQLTPLLTPAGNTTVCVRGTRFGSQEMNEDNELEVKILSDDTKVSMCSGSKWLSEDSGANKYDCLFSPTTDTIQLEIHGPSGCCDDKVRLGKTYKLDYIEPKFKKAIPDVLVLENISTTDFHLVLEAEGLPIFTEGNVQPRLWLSAGDKFSGVELCDGVDMNTTHVICQVVREVNVGKVCEDPTLHASWGQVNSETQSGQGKISIQQPEILYVEGAPKLVGKKLQYVIYGKYLGEQFNGEIKITVGDRECKADSRNETTIICTVEEGPLRDDLAGSYPFFSAGNVSIYDFAQECYQPGVTASSWNETYSNMSCDVKVMVMLGGTDCSRPVSGDPATYNSLFRDCQPGKRLENVTDDGCMDCPKGKSQPYIGPLSNCGYCELGEYQDEIGQPFCKRCPANTMTEKNGSDDPGMCLCDYGWYVAKSYREQWFEGDVVCSPCMEGGECLGGMIIPVSQPGWWMTHGVEYEAEECAFRKGCLRNNTCDVGYIGVKCEVCDDGFFTNIGFSETTCEECTAWIMTMGYAMPGALAVVFVTVIAPLFIWRLQAEWAAPSAQTVPHICFCTFDRCLRRMLYPKETMEIPTRKKTWHRPLVALVRFLDRWLVARAMKGAEFQRVVSILTNTVHILLLTGGINVRFWPEDAKKILDSFKPFLGMIDAIHPECFIPWPMLTRWLCVWAAPYVLLVFLVLFVKLQLSFSNTDWLHSRHVQCIVVGGYLHIMIVAHVREDLKVFDCRWLDDGRLELEPKVTCSFTDSTWIIMFLCAATDLVVVIFLICLIRRALVRSLTYYKTQPKGTLPPFSVSLTKWWCIGFRPHSTKHDQALREVQQGKMDSEKDKLERKKQEKKRKGKSKDPEKSTSEVLVEKVPEKDWRDHQKEWQEKVNKHNEAIFQKNAQSTGMELRRLINPLLGEGPWPLDANLDDEATFNAWSRSVSLYIHRMLTELDKTWCITSSFLLTDQDVHVAFMWEWYNLFHKLAIVLIELLMTKYQWWGSRCIMLGQSIYIAFFIWVRPYKNAALNTIDAVLGIMLCIIIYCVILEEGKDDDLTTEDLGPHTLLYSVELVHIAMVFCVIVGSVGTGGVWLISWLQSTFLQETFYVFQSKIIIDEEGSAVSENVGSHPVCSIVARQWSDLEKSEAAFLGKGKLHAMEKKLKCGANDFKPEWKIMGEEGGEESKLPIKQSLMMPCDKDMLDKVLHTGSGDVIKEVIDGLPRGSGMRLAHGGDLTGRLVVTLRGKFAVGNKWVKNVVQNLERKHGSRAGFQKEGRYELRSHIKVAGICVPKRASLKAVAFAIENEEPHWVSFDKRDQFVEKYEREFRRVPEEKPGITFLSFLRHGKEDLQLELCEEIVRATAKSDRSQTNQCRAKGVDELDEAIDMAKKALDGAGDKLTLDLRFKMISKVVGSKNPRVMVPAHVQNQDGREDSDIYILERNRQEWLCRGEEIRHRLGLRFAIRDETSLSDLKRLLERSVWQTNDGGLVVLNKNKCCNGEIKVESQARVLWTKQGIEQYSLLNKEKWKTDDEKPKEGDFADDVLVDGRINGEQADEWVSRGLLTKAFDESAPSIQMVWVSGGNAVIGYLVENRKIYWQTDEGDIGGLPQGPWQRVTSAYEGVPGPDSGLWRAKTSRYVKMDRGVDFLRAVDEEAVFHAGAGAAHLHERTKKDLNQYQRSTTNAIVSHSMLSLPEVVAVPMDGEHGHRMGDSANPDYSNMNPDMGMDGGALDGGAVELRENAIMELEERKEAEEGEDVPEPEKRGKDDAITWLSVDPRSGNIQFYPRAAQQKIETAWQCNEKSVQLTTDVSPVAATVYLEHEPFQVTDKGGVRSVRRHKLTDPRSNHVVIGIMVRPGTNSYWAKDPVGGMAAFNMQKEADASEEMVLRGFEADPNDIRIIEQTVV